MILRRLSAIAFLLAGSFALASCWIPLPEETALVVEVLDEQGNLVGDIPVLVDSVPYLTPKTGEKRGQVFRSYTTPGTHTVGIDHTTLADPQGGVPLVPRASMVSGELLPVSGAVRPFSQGRNLLVPVEKGSITRVQIFMADLLASPRDNQWLTGGDDPTAFRAGDGTREFAASPQPSFVWRQDSSFVGPVEFTFQLWEDNDGDIRYPLGISTLSAYRTTLDGVAPILPDWEIPRLGLQRARAPRDGTGRVFLWCAPAAAATAVSYDAYYAPLSLWPEGETDWESKQVIRGAVPSTDGGAVYLELGHGTPNPRNLAGRPVMFPAGVPYRFGIRARDASANLDTLAITGTRAATANSLLPSPVLWPVTSAFVATCYPGASPGQVTFLNLPAATLSSGLGTVFYRLYAAPKAEFAAKPFDERFLREVSPTLPSGLGKLVSGVYYTIGVEPVDSAGDRAAIAFTLRDVNVSSGGDVAPPVQGDPTVTVTPGPSPGSAAVTFRLAGDVSTPITYRIYRGTGGDASPTWEGLRHQDFAGPPGGAPGDLHTEFIRGLANGVTYSFKVAAIDAAGNSLHYIDPPPFILPAAPGPLWSSAGQGLFSSVSWNGQVLGWKYDYNGFGLLTAPRADGSGGEYVWRVKQGLPGGIPLSSKLAAFYAYSSYLHRSGDTTDFAAPMRMVNPSVRVRQGEVLSFLWRRLAAFSGQSPASGSVKVMNAFLGSQVLSPSQYRQRTGADFLDAQAASHRASSVNQVSIFYRTNSDGKVVSAGNASASHAFLDVVLTNRAVNNAYGPPYLAQESPTWPPLLASKRFGLTYNYSTIFPGWALDSLVVDPTFPNTGNISFTGALSTPDLSSDGFPWQDPFW